MELKEIKTNNEHYLEDNQGRICGEYRQYYDNGELFVSCYFKHGMFNGEYKMYYDDNRLMAHKLYKNDKIIKEYLSGIEL